jgi:hypothetical protein
MKAILRLSLSAIIAFCFYATWAYYANSLVTSEQDVLLKAALVQGLYSASITLFFTVLIEFFSAKLSNKAFCLPLVVPTLFKTSLFSEECATTKTFKENLSYFEKKCSGVCLPGMLITPLPALLLQSILVVGINVLFETPNLWLTVLPSILFSGIYGYIYSIALTKKKQASIS